MFSQTKISKFTQDTSKELLEFKKLLNNADAVLIGAGAGFSTAAGLSFAGQRYDNNFADFKTSYGINDMYSGSFYHFKTNEEYWAFMSRMVNLNRYTDFESKIHQNLLSLLDEKDYFVLTTNVDHLFQRSGYEKNRLFYTQGDFGLFQCSLPCHQNTYDNKELILNMVSKQKNMRIPSELIPTCPVCGRNMSMNLRSDSTFVEDSGWHNADYSYKSFLKKHEDSRLLLIEIGVGFDTPGIIKYPFWQITYKNSNSQLIVINPSDTRVPPEIKSRTTNFFSTNFLSY